MVHVIADVLKSKIAELEWIEKFGGMVDAAYKPVYAPLEGTNQQVKIGDLVYPVDCISNCEDCWHKGVYYYFIPESKKAAVAFFTDSGGAGLQQVDGPKQGWLRFRFEIRFLCWLNLERLGVEGCGFSGTAVPYIISKFFGRHTVTGLFDGGVLEDVFQGVEVTGIAQLPKDPRMFEPFSFAREGNDRGLFLYPYDYFGLTITGNFIVARHCLPALLEGWTPSAGGCLPGTGNGVPCPPNTVKGYLNGLNEYPDDETARADGLTTNDHYWTLGSDFLPGGVFKRVLPL
jgi:hypothetical protein